MARPLRIQYSDAWYHVMNRGRNREKIFCSPEEYAAFIDLLKNASALWKVRITAYCLMPNHYHLLVQTPEANLSRTMRHINGLYTQYFNRKHKSDGPLFRGRYKSIIIDGDTYLLDLLRYIHRNPLSSGLVKHLDHYPWSSHRAYISKRTEGNWLYKDYVLSMLEDNKNKRPQAYLDFMKQEVPSTLSSVYEKKKLPVILGAKDFIDGIRQKHHNKTRIKEISQVKELFLEKSWIEEAVCDVYQINITDLLKSRRGHNNEARNVAIYLMRKYAGASLTDIGARYGMNSFSSVSSVIIRIQQAMERDKNLRQRITAVEKRLT